MDAPVLLVVTIRCAECGKHYTCPHETHGRWCGCIMCPECSTETEAADERRTPQEEQGQSSLRKGSAGSGSVS